ncbi:MAG TPA: glycosyltransferase family 1 protein [Verrucomicrobiae bacterium]|nr:glycosyltransferase family 1 protein [Verrucomicrobiae bacterium]
MNIGISTSVVARGRSGVGQYLFALLRAFLPYTENRFTLFVLEEDVPLFEFAAGTMHIIPVPERFRPPVKNILWHQTQLPKLVRELELDVLHVPSYRRMLWPRPCPLVATIHDLAPFFVTKKYDGARMFYGRVVAARLARRQDRIIAISRNTARDVKRFFRLREERISIVHNGLDHDRFFPAVPDVSHAEALRKFNVRKPFFLYTARLEHPGKNHTRLIAAFNQFKAAFPSDWQLVFAGSDWHGAEIIHGTIQASPFSADIHTLGFVRDADLPDLYRAADVFVYPSLYEGFGLPPVEAMACGCPVMSSGRGALKEVVGDAVALIDPEDVPSMARQLASLAEDGLLRARLRAAGLKRAQCFNWERTAAQTMEVYRSVRSSGTD